MKNKDSASRTYGPVHLWPLALIAAGTGACFAGAAVSPAYWDFFGLLLILSLASLLLGVLPGFLFGIPRLNRNYDPREDYGRTTKYTPNTNLEDVSDWLTKIIIGVTLTQLTKIPGYLQSMADSILLNSQCETPDCALARSVIISLLIYFFAAGFIGSYYYTRLFLPNLFSIMEENSIKRAESAIWGEGARKMLYAAEETYPGQKTAFLTDDELEVLKKIKAHDNVFSAPQRLSHRENAAVNVLLAKGIVEEIPGTLFHRRGSLRIVHEAILPALK